MPYKETLAIVAIVLTFAAFFPYIRSIIKGDTKPHVFSWVIWGSTTCVVFLAQREDGGGAGAWVIGVSGVITLFIAYLAYTKRTDITITRLDKVFFISALSSLPFWYFTADPLWAVIILTVVDVLGFGPTARKAYAKPHSEPLLFFGLFVIRNGVVILALEHYSVTTVLFPAVIGVTSLLLIILIGFWRRVVGR